MAARSIGLVLSGGGARGAYEVGVLLYLADHFPQLFERVRVITGSSVGAVNGVYLAARGFTPQSVRDLASMWRALKMDDIVEVSQLGALKMITRASMRLVSKSVRSPVTGLISVGGLWRKVSHETDWRALHRHVRTKRFDAVAVAATDIATGFTHLFVEGQKDALGSWSTHDPVLLLKPGMLGPHHVLASAAIPVLFPPVRVHGRWYMDGGVRYNTPLSPALYFGAESLVIITVRANRPESPRPDEFPGLGQMVGKLLDSVFLDRVAFDLDRLTRINDFVTALEGAGPGVLEHVRADLIRRGRRPYRKVPVAAVRPEKDLGALAAEYLAKTKTPPFSFGRVLRALFEDDTQTSGDAASFLLFDGGFASLLIDAGRRDAASAHAAFAAL
ncbi:patatin-like phospholipase family protein [Myxococcota bacterium]|nr:patatin-like phospholipase family protein [Myxococcota bacterium]